MAEVPNGKFVWYDLMTPDTGASADFYTKLIGWSTMALRVPRRASPTTCG